ncbi:hypothetical protein ACXDF8_10080 [Mycolicibacterium sp. CBM1]
MPMLENGAGIAAVAEPDGTHLDVVVRCHVGGDVLDDRFLGRAGVQIDDVEGRAGGLVGRRGAVTALHHEIGCCAGDHNEGAHDVGPPTAFGEGETVRLGRKRLVDTHSATTVPDSARPAQGCDHRNRLTVSTTLSGLPGG